MAGKVFMGALRDWWRELLPLALANLLWLVGVVLIIGGPPATAAMFALAWRGLRHEYITLGDLIYEAGRLFWRGWALALLTLLGLFIGTVDLYYYNRVATGLVGTLGSLLLLYLLILWIQAQAYAWALLGGRPDLSPIALQRQGLTLAARYPGFSLLMLIALVGLLALNVVLPPLIGLATAALGALFCVHSLARLAPGLLTEEDRARLAALDAADAMQEPPEARRRGRT